MSLPPWLVEKMQSCPAEGGGAHGFLYSAARQLHAHLDLDGVITALTSATTHIKRHGFAREIRDAAINSQGTAWQPKGARSARWETKEGSSQHDYETAKARAERWPKFDPIAQRCRIADAADEVPGVYELWERSPAVPFRCVDDWLDWLFPDAEWLCLAETEPGSARSRRREKWYFGAADKCSFIVPSPMTGPSGKRLDGKTSHRCLDNTGPRRWLVIEFDPSKFEDLPRVEQIRYRDEIDYNQRKIDEQAALHWHLRESAAALGWPLLRLCVLSGGKSLHAWWGPVEREEAAYELLYYAVSLGADTSSWNRAQLMRLPYGVRTVKPVEFSMPDGWEQPPERVRQEVVYFEPEQFFKRT